MKKYACADLHGNYALWQKIKEHLGEDDWLFMLGDAADRGLRGWEIIKEALADPRVIYIRGNHDQMLLDAWKTGWADSMLWFYNNGYPTFEAIMNDKEAESYLRELDKTQQFISLKEEGRELILTHAGFTPPYAETDVLWDRDHISDDWPIGYENTYIVHGHTPVVHLEGYGAQKVQYNEARTVGKYAAGRKICIDGLSAFSGKCALLDLQTLKDISLFEK